MLHDPKMTDEAGRLAALKRLGLMDTPPESQFDAINTLVATIFEAPVVLISLMDDCRQWYKASIGIDFREIPRNDSLCDHTIRLPDALVVEDATLDPRVNEHPLVTGQMAVRSYLGTPLRTPDGYNVGTICVIDFKPRRISEQQVEILRQFAALIVDQAELRQIASLDSLSGTWTRRAFLDAASREFARVQRHGQPAALAILDLDHFKGINDAYGHAAGDAVLRTIGEICRTTLRTEDVIGRLGGEEFAILLPGTAMLDAMVAIERLRLAIASARIPSRPALRFTASFGVAGLTPDIESIDEWMERADAGLYEAKRSGRNRTIAQPASAEVL